MRRSARQCRVMRAAVTPLPTTPTSRAPGRVTLKAASGTVVTHSRRVLGCRRIHPGSTPPGGCRARREWTPDLRIGTSRETQHRLLPEQDGAPVPRQVAAN
jgi:hypothetical protein